jgi:hypothetical protein
MVFLAAVAVLVIGSSGTMLERHALREPGSTALMLAVLFVAWISIRFATVALARHEEQDLRFEEEITPAVQGLGLNRDGVMPLS